MQSLQSIRTMAIGLLLMATFPAAAQALSLGSLPEATQNDISRICLPVQFSEGAGAYRNCVQAELDFRSNGSKTDMGNLSFDDKYAVQQACANAGEQPSTNYQSCVSKQVSNLNTVAKPALDKLSEDELYVVQQSCFNAQSTLGAASYRQCLNSEVQSFLSTPAADTSNLDMLKKNALQLRCSSNSSTAVQYRECVAAQFESIAGFAPSFLPVTAAQTATLINGSIPTLAATQLAGNNQATRTATASPRKPRMGLPRNITPPEAEIAATKVSPAAAPATTQLAQNTVDNVASDTNENIVAPIPAPTVNNTTAGAARVISRPKLVETLKLQERTKAQGTVLEPDNITDASTPVAATSQAMQKAGAFWQKFLDALASLDGVGWLLIAGVLALPALLLGIFSLIRRVKTSADTPVHNASLTERIEPGMRTRLARQEQEAAALFDDEDAVSDHDDITRIATKPKRPDLRKPEREPVAQSESDAAEFLDALDEAQPSDHAWQSAFGHWLMQQPEPARMEACIEFLIYWVAYGDDRYQPDLKKQLFTKTDLDSHDQIKRWVLKQDVFAFADVVGWMRIHATQKQQQQCIGLIMALLVTEHSVTPVQNTLLRFLSDAFNTGKDRLEQRFQQAFGHALPPMPRTDNDAWWVKQEPDMVQRWDARAMAARSETEQFMARLGLAANYDETHVIQAFRRAARRCHPDRFTELGDRERALAEQQFHKFEQARDKLLGVSV